MQGTLRYSMLMARHAYQRVGPTGRFSELVAQQIQSNHTPAAGRTAIAATYHLSSLPVAANTTTFTLSTHPNKTRAHVLSPQGCHAGP
jgi:hypothetical protein